MKFNQIIMSKLKQNSNNIDQIKSFKTTASKLKLDSNYKI